MPIQLARRALRGGASFSPLQLPGLKVWLDAGQIPSLSDGDPVTTWNDISGNANHATQATGSKKPTYKVSIINGRPVVRFDGVDDLLQNAGLTQAQPYTVIAVLSYANVSDGALNIYWDSNATALAYAGKTIGSKLEYYAGSAAVASSGNVPAPFHIATVTWNGASSLSRIDGTQAASGNPGSNGLAGYRIGLAQNNTAPFHGDLAELVACVSPSAAQITKAERYFGAKYAITVS